MKTNFSQFFKKNKNNNGGISEKDLRNIEKFPRMKKGTVSLFGCDFTYTDNLSFVDTYKEIFINEIYKFHESSNNGKEKVILDCGANIGLSTLYFSKKYPRHRIICFEPDPELFEVLTINMKSNEVINLECKNTAVWINDDELSFYSDGGMAGNLFSGRDDLEVKVRAEKLEPYLSKEIDFLKIDIEGAEIEVLKANEMMLGNVQNIFVEYHCYVNERQQLEVILDILTKCGFRYFIKDGYISKTPLWDNPTICGNIEMTINIFGKRA